MKAKTALLWIALIELVGARPPATTPAPQATPLSPPVAPALRRDPARATSKPLQGGPVQLLWKEKTLRIPVGNAREIRWSGGGKALPQVENPDRLPISAQLKPGLCSLTARASCDGTITLVWPKQRWTIPIWARPAAGELPDLLALQLTGGADLEQALSHRLLALRSRDAQVKMALQGDKALIQLTGPQLYPVEKTVKLKVERSQRSPQPAQQLFLSNRPEKFAQPGVLFARSWDGQGGCRWLFHHKNTGPQDLYLELRCRNGSPSPASFHQVLSCLGPARDEIYVGHIATQRYLQLLSEGASGWFTRVDGESEIVLERLRVKPEQTVSGLCLVSAQGPFAQPLELRVVAVDLNGQSPEVQIESSESRTARGVFAAERSHTVSYKAGDKFLFLELGGPPYEKDAGKGEESPGNFGMVYRYQIELANPSGEPYTFALAASARGGPARGHFFVDGVLKDPGNLGVNPATLQQWTLEPGGERTVWLETLPQSGSNYPLSLIISGLRASPQANPSEAGSGQPAPRRIP